MALDTGFVVASADFPMRPLEAHRKTAFCPANSEENSGQPLGLPRPRTVPDENSAGGLDHEPPITTWAARSLQSHSR
jgi:hypothetical protein